MDQVRIGKFIAELRRGQGLTQEALGGMIGVSNKTVSRWENGNYMPDIEMLQILSRTFGVSSNERLAGRRIPDADFRNTADQNIVELSRESVFSREEKEAFFKEKWRRDHKSLRIFFGILVLLAVLLPVFFGKTWPVCFSPVLAAVLYSCQNNSPVAYVERQLYDCAGTGGWPGDPA